MHIRTMTSMTGKVLGEAFETTGVENAYSFHHFGDDVTVEGFDSLEAAWDALWVYHEDEYQYGNA